MLTRQESQVDPGDRPLGENQVEDSNGATRPLAHTPRRAILVRVMIGVTVLVVLAATASIYYHWLIVTEPTSAIVVEGDDSVAGALIKVTHVHDLTTASAQLNAENGYVSPVLINPGTYDVDIILNGASIYHSQPTVDAYRVLKLKLSLKNKALPHRQ